MRKLSLITLSIIMLGGIISCKKNESTPISENDRTVQNILDFKSSVLKKSGNGENMLIDSALWYIEATLNMSYAFTHDLFINRETDSLFVSVETINGCEVAFADVVNAYLEMEQYIAQQYANYPAENKHIELVDLILADESINGPGFWIYSSVGEVVKDEDETKSTYPYNSYDWWSPFPEQGRCDGVMAGEDLGREAAYELESDANSFHFRHDSYTSFVDVLFKYTCGDAFPNTDPGTLDRHPYLIWMRMWEGPVSPVCLSPDDMHFYFINIPVISSSFVPSGKNVASFEILIDHHPEYNYSRYIYHYRYGTKISNVPPPEDPAIRF